MDYVAKDLSHPSAAELEQNTNRNSLFAPPSPKHIGYVAGDLPIVISVPHGGYRRPEHIPDRQSGCLVGGRPIFRHDCSELSHSSQSSSSNSSNYSNSSNPNASSSSSSSSSVSDSKCSHPQIPVTKVKDIYTKELVYDIDDAFQIKFGKSPYIIICELHRKKLDMNREIEEATFGHPDAVEAWNEYHNTLKQMKSEIITKFGCGLMIDLHGQTHEEEWIELGYLITSKDLEMLDEEINENGKSEMSSINTLAQRVHPKYSFSDVLRGLSSLGGLLSSPEHWMDGTDGVKFYKTVPSPKHPSPEGKFYYWGAYLTRTHGSVNGGQIDAVQMELPKFIRQSKAERITFAKTFVSVISQFMKTFYDCKHFLTNLEEK